MKKLLCVMLAALMLASLTGCFSGLFPNGGEATANPTAAPSSSPTNEPSATETATETPSDAPVFTDEPAATQAPSVDANAAFAELDLEIFRTLVCSSSDTYNQYIASDPAKFGIDPADVTPGWGDLSYDAHIESMGFARDCLDELNSIEYSALSEKNKHAFDTLKRTFETQLLYEDYYYYDEPLEPLNGYHTMLPLSMLCFNIRKLEDVESYLVLVEDMERMIDDIGKFEEEKAGEGLFMCEVALDQVVESCRNFAAKGEDSFLIPLFEEVLDKAKELGASEADCAAYRERNHTLVIEHVLPAYTRLADTLESHRADCMPFVGASERGEEALAYFELSARDEGATMDDMDTVVELLEQMGLDTYLDMVYAVIYGGDEVMDEYGDPITMGSVEENLEWLRDFADQYYPPMPEHQLEYIEVPEDIADDFSPAAYLTPAFDDFYDNLMLINPTTEGSDDLLTIAHETIPGHMYQFLSARNDPDLSLAQQVFEPTGYAEAWTVFTEKFVATKCYDVGINYCTMMNCESTFCNIFLPAYISIMVNREGWSMEEVSDYLEDYGIADAADIFYEYAITMPVYSMSYAVGYSYLYDIFMEIEPDSPAQFKAFFDKYLSYGPTYMDMIHDYMLGQ